jgi:hypothetical protein
MTAADGASCTLELGGNICSYMALTYKAISSPTSDQILVQHPSWLATATRQHGSIDGQKETARASACGNNVVVLKLVSATKC